MLYRQHLKYCDIWLGKWDVACFPEESFSAHFHLTPSARLCLQQGPSHLTSHPHRARAVVGRRAGTRVVMLDFHHRRLGADGRQDRGPRFLPPSISRPGRPLLPRVCSQAENGTCPGSLPFKLRSSIMSKSA